MSQCAHIDPNIAQHRRGHPNEPWYLGAGYGGMLGIVGSYRQVGLSSVC